MIPNSHQIPVTTYIKPIKNNTAHEVPSYSILRNIMAEPDVDAPSYLINKTLVINEQSHLHVHKSLVG